MVSAISGCSSAAILARSARAIDSQFSDLAPVRLQPMAGGDDFHAFLANGRWIFRFPRGRVLDLKLRREHLLLPGIAAALRPLPIRVPSYEKTGSPSPEFPYSFAGYRLIPGVAADRVGRARLDQRQLARVLGRAISRLHLMDENVVVRAGIPRDPRTPRRVLARLRARALKIEPVLPLDLRRAANGYLSSSVAMPRSFTGAARFLHNDLCPNHILIGPANGRLNGLVDFSDAALGDPALDFANLYSWLGRGFVLELLRWYNAPRDPEFELRVTFFARTLSLQWLADAARKGDRHDVLKHLRWVRRAFRN